ncbi:hypothetical protein ACTA71_007661 [Dictyostelium dimigraforme]
MNVYYMIPSTCWWLENISTGVTSLVVLKDKRTKISIITNAFKLKSSNITCYEPYDKDLEKVVKKEYFNAGFVERILHESFSRLVQLYLQHENGSIKGFAFINFDSFDASETMNGQYFCNKLILYIQMKDMPFAKRIIAASTNTGYLNQQQQKTLTTSKNGLSKNKKATATTTKSNYFIKCLLNPNQFN